jgi:exodeoxyribonuclease-3
MASTTVVEAPAASPPLSKRLKAAGVDRHVRGWEKTSDHAPVWIEVSGKTP